MYCPATNTALNVEHVIPKSWGGTGRVSHLTIACKECNLGKGDRQQRDPDILPSQTTPAGRGSSRCDRLGTATSLRCIGSSPRNRQRRHDQVQPQTKRTSQS
ncbi:MAG: HNH endonuclease [Limnochordia bacterium]